MDGRRYYRVRFPTPPATSLTGLGVGPRPHRSAVHARPRLPGGLIRIGCGPLPFGAGPNPQKLGCSPATGPRRRRGRSGQLPRVGCLAHADALFSDRAYASAGSTVVVTTMPLMLSTFC